MAHSPSHSKKKKYQYQYPCAPGKSRRRNAKGKMRCVYSSTPNTRRRALRKLRTKEGCSYGKVKRNGHCVYETTPRSRRRFVRSITNCMPGKYRNSKGRCVYEKNRRSRHLARSKSRSSSKRHKRVSRKASIIRATKQILSQSDLSTLTLPQLKSQLRQVFGDELVLKYQHKIKAAAKTYVQKHPIRVPTPRAKTPTPKAKSPTPLSRLRRLGNRVIRGAPVPLEKRIKNCAICMDDFTSDNPRFDLPCGHPLHRDCLIDLYKSGADKKCPYCKKTIYWSMAKIKSMKESHSDHPY